MGAVTMVVHVIQLYYVIYKLVIFTKFDQKWFKW